MPDDDARTEEPVPGGSAGDLDDGGSGAGARPTTTAGRADGAVGARVGGATMLLAALMAGAGVIHLVMVPSHTGGDSWLDPVAFAVVGWAQLAVALVLLLGRADRRWLVGTAVGNALVVGAWLLSRTTGLPVGAHAGVVEEVGLVDAVATAFEVAAVLLAAALALWPSRARTGVVAPALASVAVVALTTVALVSPDATTHGGGGEHAQGSGHSHDAGAGHDDTHGATHASASGGSDHRAEMADLDRRRCDEGFNPRSYWEEARALGVDTYSGGAMAPHAETDPVELASSDPLGGRGSPGLDRLVSATSMSGGGENAASELVVALSEASGDDYRAWLRWMTATGSAGGGHEHGGSTATAAAPDDNEGHGGHAGPQPWVAMVDDRDCIRLARELEVARDTALMYPTAADAMAAGWVRVTPYVPGIGAHYMNFRLVDGVFDVEEPEMILYDGNGPEARVVGLSYYVLHSGDAEPTQGFTGPNDHFHRHVGLCTKPGAGVIGDSTMSAEDCASLGGFKSNNRRGWMNHAWVVPGCESPWGVFSGASPLLDRSLGEASGTDDGGCAGSGVKRRYDLRPGGQARVGTGEQAGG